MSKRLIATVIELKHYTEMYRYFTPISVISLPRKKKKSSTLAKKIDNYNRSRRNLKRLIDNNFTKNHSFLTLTFSPQHYPETFSTNKDSLKKSNIHLKNFIEFLRSFPSKLPLKYIAVPEIQYKNTLNWHYHILVNRRFSVSNRFHKLFEYAKNKNSNVHLIDIQHNTNIGLYVSKYLSKNKNYPKSARKYITSKNLDKPLYRYYYTDSIRADLINFKPQYQTQFLHNGYRINYYYKKNDSQSKLPRQTNIHE